MKRKLSYKNFTDVGNSPTGLSWVYPGDRDQFDTIQPDLGPAFGVAGSLAQTRGQPGGSLRCRESKKGPAHRAGP